MDTVPEEILNGFSKSWAETLLFFNNLIDSNQELGRLIPFSIFIKKWKQSGMDKNFRLGNVRDSLVFSRSAASLLRADQKFIQIQALDKLFVITLRDSKKMYREYRIKDLDDELLTGLLQTLKLELID